MTRRIAFCQDNSQINSQGGNNNQQQQQQQGNNANANAASGQQDALDKAVQFGEERFIGHDLATSTTEAISDNIRSGFKAVTGHDIPIADKQ